MSQKNGWDDGWNDGLEVTWDVGWEVGWDVGWELVWVGLGLGSRTPWPCRNAVFLQCNGASGRSRRKHAFPRPGHPGGSL